MSTKLTGASSVEIGFLSGATYPSGVSVALVASVHEWGAPRRNIPPRPFFGVSDRALKKCDEALVKIGDQMSKDFDAVTLGTMNVSV